MYYVAIILVLLWTSMVYGGPMAFVCSPEPCEVVIDDPAIDIRFSDIENRLLALEGGSSSARAPIVPGDPLELQASLPIRSVGLMPTGHIINQGTMTFDETRLQVRQERAAMNPLVPTTVVLNEGIQYMETHTVMSVNDAGTAEAPIRYMAPPGKWTHLTGGRRIDPGLFNLVVDQVILDRLHPDVQGKVLQADLSSWTDVDFVTPTPVLDHGTWPQTVDGSRLDLIYEGTEMPLARWPNKGVVFLQNVNTVGGVSFSYSEPNPDFWALETQAYIHGQFMYDYADSYAPVDFINTTTKTIVVKPFDTAPIFHEFGFKSGQPYSVINVLAELDQPGEWYFDRITKILYFYPPETVLDGNPNIELSVGRILLDINNASFVTFEGIVFENSRTRMVMVDDGDSVNFEDCVIRNGGSGGLRIRNGKNNKVTNCEIYGFAESGLIAVGGDRVTLTPGNLVVENNDIHHNGRLIHSAQLVSIGGVGNTLRHNHLHHGPFFAISLKGNNHLMELNSINDVVLKTGDSGAIYSGRDWTRRGNIIRWNYFKNVNQATAGSVQCIYFDDFMSGFLVYGNIMEDAFRGVMIGGGRDNKVFNNIFKNMIEAPIVIDGRGSADIGGLKAYDPNSEIRQNLAAMPYTTPPWSDQYPKLATILAEDPGQPFGNEFKKNIFLGNGQIRILSGAEGKVDIQDNYDDSQPGFGLVIDSNFQLDAASLASSGFEQIPFHLIGRQ